MIAPTEDNEWASNQWSQDVVSHLIAKSPQTVRLVAQDSESSSTIHKELLCFFSTHYRNVTGTTEDATIQVNLNGHQLRMFVCWIYVGPSAEIEEDVETRTHLIKLYIFAEDSGILALRRWVMTKICQDVWLGTYQDANLAFSSLSHNSALCQYLVEEHIWHGHVHEFLEAPNDYEEAPKAFLYQVLRGIRRQWRDAKTTKGNTKDCTCLENACDWHEHESEQEWNATCGVYEDKNFQMPESRFLKKAESQ